MAGLIHDGIASLGHGVVAWAQFSGATVLSAILDNNIVADFASRALVGFDLQTLHLFAMAQIAGYALGGCWTHIGSAQSVVAYSFIQRDVDAAFTPVQWIKQMTPINLEMFALITAVIAIESWLL
jgi:Na+/H+ antiporter NhaD/arsenite permease-like protein